jgi:hypothetical protein
MTRRGLLLLTIGLLLVCWTAPAAAQQYPTYSEIGPALLDAETQHPDICKRYDLGLSVQGRHLWAVRISDNVLVEEDEPEFHYISTMHGDEWLGVPLCMNLIDYLLDNYGSDQRVTDIVNGVEVWIVPLMNPDGYSASPPTRENANGVDLNRHFPDPYTSPNNTPTGRAIEIQDIMNWAFGRSPTLSANFHTGSLVVNYPFDANASGNYVYTPTPDDDLFVYISEEYSQHNQPMWNGPFYHGITNGADWYVIYGGMQDWNYVYMGSNEVTIELSTTFIPPASQIPTYWNNNRESMLAYIETCLIGVRGIVTDAATGLPLSATITVAGRDHEVYTDPDVGDYHRMLMPGTYDLTFEAEGFDPLTITGVVVSSGPATRLDVAMAGPPVVTYPNGGETLTAGTATTITWTGSPVHQYQVQYTQNADDLQTETDGFETGILGPQYSTGGDADWYVTDVSPHTGTYCARAGDIDDDQESWMTRTATGGALSFHYRVSSEANYDWFNFYIDGERMIHRAGNVSWEHYSTTLAEGSHELRWEYVKDRNITNGDDTVWIDNLQITTDNTVWTDVINLTDPGVSSAEWTPVDPGSDYKVRVRMYFGAGQYSVWDASDGTFTVEAGPTCPGDLNGDGFRNATDFTVFATAYGSHIGDPNYNPDADITGDGFVNVSDFTVFGSYYGVPCP